jgi:hypothetical protein
MRRDFMESQYAGPDFSFVKRKGEVDGGADGGGGEEDGIVDGVSAVAVGDGTASIGADDDGGGGGGGAAAVASLALGSATPSIAEALSDGWEFIIVCRLGLLLLGVLYGGRHGHGQGRRRRIGHRAMMGGGGRSGYRLDRIEKLAGTLELFPAKTLPPTLTLSPIRSAIFLPGTDRAGKFENKMTIDQLQRVVGRFHSTAPKTSDRVPNESNRAQSQKHAAKQQTNKQKQTTDHGMRMADAAINPFHNHYHR